MRTATARDAGEGGVGAGCPVSLLFLGDCLEGGLCLLLMAEELRVRNVEPEA